MGSYRDYRHEFRRLKVEALMARCRSLDTAREPVARCHAAIDELLDTAFTTEDGQCERDLVDEARRLAETIAGQMARQPALATLLRDSFAAAVHYRTPFTTFYLPDLH
ncbi:hypothetical protein [Caenispirillum salinarum]|uniref:hypothetical protein n=1 Tax=Caenispirillum salinarum TaxID=859058 RepID=UPI00384DFF67